MFSYDCDEENNNSDTLDGFCKCLPENYSAVADIERLRPCSGLIDRYYDEEVFKTLLHAIVILLGLGLVAIIAAECVMLFKHRFA